MKELRSVRLKVGMTQKEVAEAISVSQAAIAKWETGKSSPSLSNLIKLADIYNTSVDSLVRK